MTSRLGRSVTAVLALAALAGTPATAEGQEWSITPFVGYYLPTGDLISGSNTFPDFPGFTGEVTAENKGGIGFGGLLGYTLPSGLGFEAGVGYYQSDVEGDVCAFDDVGDELECATFDESGSVIPLLARVSYRFTPPTASAQFYGAAGVAYLLRGGDAWDDDEIEKNVFGGTLALGMLYPLSPMLKLRVEVADFLYSSEPLDGADIEAIAEAAFLEDAAGGSVDSKFKNDFTLSVGIMIPFGGQ